MVAPSFQIAHEGGGVAGAYLATLQFAHHLVAFEVVKTIGGLQRRV